MAKLLSADIAARFLLAFSTIIVLGMALYPNLRLPELTPLGGHSDFIYHMIAFLVLTVLATITLERNVLVFTSMAVFAIALELLQTFIPGRSVFLIDVVASLLGTLLAPLAKQLWRRLFGALWRHGY